MTGTVYSGLNLEAVAERVRLSEDQAVYAGNIGTACNLRDISGHAADFGIIYDAGFEQGSHDTFINE